MLKPEEARAPRRRPQGDQSKAIRAERGDERRRAGDERGLEVLGKRDEAAAGGEGAYWSIHGSRCSLSNLWKAAD